MGKSQPTPNPQSELFRHKEPETCSRNRNKTMRLERRGNGRLKMLLERWVGVHVGCLGYNDDYGYSTHDGQSLEDFQQDNTMMHFLL